jgi:hypothetical protein
LSSVFDAKGEFFDDWIGEDFASDALDLIPGIGGFKTLVECEEKVFALADIIDATIFHAPESIGDGLALGIEDGSFQSDIDMGLHDV